MQSLFKIFSLASTLFLFIFFISASLAWAQDPCTKVGETYKCENPLQAGDVPKLIESVVSQVWPFAISIVSFIIILTGYRYLYAVAVSGNPNQISQRRDQLLKVILWSSVIAGATVIVNAVVKFAQELT